MARFLPVAVLGLALAAACGARSEVWGDELLADGGTDAGEPPALTSVPFFGVAGNSPFDGAVCDSNTPPPPQDSQRCSGELSTDAIVLGTVESLSLVTGPVAWGANAETPSASCAGPVKPVLDVEIQVRYRLRGQTPDVLHARVPALFFGQWIPTPESSASGVAWTPSTPSSYPDGAGPIVVGQAIGAFLYKDATDGVWPGYVFHVLPRAGTNEAACCFHAMPCGAAGFPGGCRMLAVDLSKEVVDCEAGRIQPQPAPVVPTTAERRRDALPYCGL